MSCGFKFHSGSNEPSNNNNKKKTVLLALIFFHSTKLYIYELHYVMSFSSHGHWKNN